MKTNQKFHFAALMLAASLATATLSANTTIVTVAEAPTLQQENPGTPGKKKCRRCVSWRPVRLFEKGQLEASFSVGAVPTFLMDGAKIKMLPVSLGLDYRFGEKFSLGVVAGHSVSESKPKVFSDGLKATWTNSFFHVALRPAIHVTSVEDWDFYGGFSIGMQSSQVTGKSNGQDFDLKEMESHLGIASSKTNAAFSGFAGLRYVLNPKWTVNGEIGFGVSIFTVGVTRLLN